MSTAPINLSAPISVNSRLSAALHSITPDGRVMHSFVKEEGVWVCACGEKRDRFGVRK